MDRRGLLIASEALIIPFHTNFVPTDLISVAGAAWGGTAMLGLAPLSLGRIGGVSWLHGWLSPFALSVTAGYLPLLICGIWFVREVGFRKGTAGPNTYGPPPGETATSS